MSKVKISKAYTAFIESPEEKFLSSYMEYDSNGNLIAAITYASEDEMESKTTALYNENSQILEEKNYMDTDDISEHIRYSRDEDGKIDHITISYADGSESVKKYIRDAANNSLTIEITDDEGEFEGREYYILNEREEIILKKIQNEDGKLTEMSTSEYDSEGRVVKISEYETEELVDMENLYKYNSDGRLESRIRINRKRELIEKISFLYDEKGNLTEQSFNDLYLIKLQYDDEGRIICEERFNAAGILESKVESRFNEEGLVIEEKTPVSITTYQYEFYE